MAPRTLGRIVLVEDDAGARQAIAQWLGQAGYAVEAVADGHEALRVVDSNTQVVISDLWMPRMDGLALLEELRRRHPARVVPAGRSRSSEMPAGGSEP